MTLAELIRHLMPDGTDAYPSSADAVDVAEPSYEKCPTWPVDLFAVTGTIIERSGCYTLASPDRKELKAHADYLDTISQFAEEWNKDISHAPEFAEHLWGVVFHGFGQWQISAVRDEPILVRILLALFALADEACVGMGWDVDPTFTSTRKFSAVAFAALTNAGTEVNLPYEPTSLCVMVPPDRAVVLPKAITSSVGCTIRSLSHHLALLPPSSVLQPQWFLSSKHSVGPHGDAAVQDTIRLLLIPFPFKIHDGCFKLSFPRTCLGGENHFPAYFELKQRWLEWEGSPLTGQQLADGLIAPLIREAIEITGYAPTGVILPECALTTALATELVSALADSGIEFLITGVLDSQNGKHLNRALTFAIQQGGEVALAEQNKHHRWRLDRTQTDRYGLHFDDTPKNDKWWEDIDVSKRELPFFGLRKDMSLATLICEDLARTDPAMIAIRAIGPNLVVALLMDGPQLAVRWPGRYATVLAEDPGSAVLSFTCAAMVDRSNAHEAKPSRSIGLWRDRTGTMHEICLPNQALGVLLTLQSEPKLQNTLDNRSDKWLSRQLSLRTVRPLFLARQPDWL